MRRPGIVHPGHLIDRDGVHDERISLPSADRVTHRRYGVSVWMTSSVRVDIARQGILERLEEHIDPPRRLHEFEWRGHGKNAGHPLRQAIHFGIQSIQTGLARVRDAFSVGFVNLQGPWLERSVFRAEPALEPSRL